MADIPEDEPNLFLVGFPGAAMNRLPIYGFSGSLRATHHHVQEKWDVPPTPIVTSRGGNIQIRRIIDRRRPERDRVSGLAPGMYGPLRIEHGERAMEYPRGYVEGVEVYPGWDPTFGPCPYEPEEKMHLICETIDFVV